MNRLIKSVKYVLDNFMIMLIFSMCREYFLIISLFTITYKASCIDFQQAVVLDLSKYCGDVTGVVEAVAQLDIFF